MSSVFGKKLRKFLLYNVKYVGKSIIFAESKGEKQPPKASASVGD